MSRVIEDAFSHLLLRHMVDEKSSPPMGVLQHAAVRRWVTELLYDHPDGACNEWLATVLCLDVELVKPATRGLMHMGRIFVHFEDIHPGKTARWRLTPEGWLEEAARRAQVSGSD